MNRVDVKCRICLSILIKPVILPCGHEFCLECFEKHLNITSGSCPLCRRRVGTWARHAKRNNGLVNQLRWQTIQRNFPDQVTRRLNNLDTSSEAEMDADMDSETKITPIRPSHFKLTEKIKNSGTFQATLPRVSSADKPGCSGVSTSSEVTKQLPKRSASAESVDSISPELNHFRPIKTEPKTPPRRVPQESSVVLKPCFMVAKPRNLNAELDAVDFPAPLTRLVVPRWLQMVAPNSNKNTHLQQTPPPSSQEPPNCDKKTDDEGGNNKSKSQSLKKRKKQSEMCCQVNKIGLLEKRSTCRKRQQEMEDYKLALKIQRNINKGLYNVDRSVSSGSPYFLRRRNPQRS